MFQKISIFTFLVPKFNLSKDHNYRPMKLVINVQTHAKLTAPKMIVRLRDDLGFTDGVVDGLTVSVVLKLLPLTVELTDVGRPSVAVGGESNVS